MFPNNLFLSITYKRRSVQLAQIKRATSALMNLTLNIFWVGTLPVNPVNPVNSVLCIVGGTAERNKNHLYKGQLLSMSDRGSTSLSLKVTYAAFSKT